MKAVQLLEHGTPGKFEVRALPELVPGAGQVVVSVAACGLNRLDLWLEEARLPMPLQLPRIPGAEISGTVLRLGAEVTGWQVGERVAVQSNLFCGTCEFCQQGEESLCLKSLLLGVQADGGMAEEVLVPARSLVRLPEGVSFQTAAALTLAGSTAMHMLTNRARVQSGEWVLVIGGASGVGSAGIQIAKVLGARVITTASNEAKRELATRLGADHVLDTANRSWTAEVRRITDKRGVSLVLEHVGGDLLPQIFNCLARGGTVVTCGATAGSDVHFDLWPFFVKQQRLVGSYGRNRADIEATLQWAAAGKLRPVINKVYDLPDARAAFAHLRSRQVLGKVLVVNPAHRQ